MQDQIRGVSRLQTADPPAGLSKALTGLHAGGAQEFSHRPLVHLRFGVDDDPFQTADQAFQPFLSPHFADGLGVFG